MKQLHKISYSFSASSFDTPPPVALRTSGLESTSIPLQNVFLSPLAWPHAPFHFARGPLYRIALHILHPLSLRVRRSLGEVRSVFASKMYRRVLFLLLVSPFCNAKEITFQAIENYINKPQPHSHVDYLSFEALCKHANGLFSKEHYNEAIAFYKQAWH